MDPTRHLGRVALVTGSGSGIGRATIERLIEEGATVVASDHNAARLEKLRHEVPAGPGTFTPALADVSKDEDCRRAVATALDTHGRIDLLANVAGINDWFLPVHELDDATWEHVLAVNLNGPMYFCRAALPSMMARRSGSIVNIASVGGLVGGASGAAYTASKHGLVGLTRSIAWAYRTEGVRCNAICPGGVETNIGTTSIPRSRWGMERLSSIHALAGRTAKPDEIAALISWLACEEASNVNGAIIPADNGWTAG